MNEDKKHGLICSIPSRNACSAKALEFRTTPSITNPYFLIRYALLVMPVPRLEEENLVNRYS